MPFRVDENSPYKSFGRIRSEEEIADELRLMQSHVLEPDERAALCNELEMNNLVHLKEKSRELGMSTNEYMYQAFQAYDNMQ